MRKYLILVFLIATLICKADSNLSQIPHIFDQEYFSENSLNLDPETKDKYQSAAHFFSKSTSRVLETNLVTYENLPTGVRCHVGWYSDGNIATALNGTEQGKQVVVLNGAVVGISYDLEIKGDHFVHNYTWGKVYSYPNRQTVIFK